MGTNGHGDHKLIAKMEMITPEMAGDLLSRNRHNRKMSNATAKRLAETMTSGQWRSDNGETIKIATDGSIADGQHRLAAVVMANKPVQMLVVRDVPRETFDTIDIGRVRTMADMLYINGEEKRQKQLATAARVLHGYLDSGNFGSIPSYRMPTPAELFALLDAHPALRESLIPGERLSGALRNIPQGTAIVVHYVLSKIDRKAANEFYEQLTSGVGIDGAMLRFRDRCLARHRGKLQKNDAAALLFKLWNARRLGTIDSMAQVGFRTTGPKPEQFPKPV